MNSDAEVRHDEAKATSFMRDEAGTRRFRCLRHRSRLGLLPWDAQKPNNCACLSRNPSKIFPKCEASHTSRPISERCCLRNGRIGAHRANAD
jgi:hypothetical protein